MTMSWEVHFTESCYCYLVVHAVPVMLVSCDLLVFVDSKPLADLWQQI